MRQILKQLITINRPTYTNGANMGITTAPVAVYTDLAASIQPATSTVMMFYAQRQLKVTQTIFVTSPVVLERGDTISDGTITYQVIGWRDLSGRGKVTAIDVEVYE